MSPGPPAPSATIINPEHYQITEQDEKFYDEMLSQVKNVEIQNSTHIPASRGFLK